MYFTCTFIHISHFIMLCAYIPHLTTHKEGIILPSPLRWYLSLASTRKQNLGQELCAGSLRSDARQQTCWMEERKKLNTRRCYKIILNCSAHPWLPFWRDHPFLSRWLRNAPWGTNSLLHPGYIYVSAEQALTWMLGQRARHALLRCCG